MYIFLDYFFLLFHSILILFVLSAWAWKSTRQIHLIITALILLSWFGLGFFYGWGYCPCTDWHWAVKYKIGENYLPNSYVKYYADKLTGLTWNPFIVDVIVLIPGIMTFILSCWLNTRDYYSNRNTRHIDPH